MPDPDPAPPLAARLRRRGPLALAGAGLLAIGGVAGAFAVHESRPTVTMAPARPVAIASLAADGDDDRIVTVRGRVADIFGNRFILADGSGRALVDTGPAGEEEGLVAVGAPVTVQGRFDRGAIRAAFLVGADGKVAALGPPGRGPRDHDCDGGHGRRHGPGRDDGGPPPPPPGDPSAQAAPATAAPAGN